VCTRVTPCLAAGCSLVLLLQLGARGNASITTDAPVTVRAVEPEVPAVRIRQYTYFALKSETLPAETITARLGIEPDAVRGARRVDPPVPACHSWAGCCCVVGSADEHVVPERPDTAGSSPHSLGG
jgi:hypothetical protein